MRVVLFSFKSLSPPPKQRELLGCAHNTAQEDDMNTELDAYEQRLCLIRFGGAE